MSFLVFYARKNVLDNQLQNKFMKMMMRHFLKILKENYRLFEKKKN